MEKEFPLHPSKGFLPDQDYFRGRELSFFTPPLEGRMYDAYLLYEDSSIWVVKVLKVDTLPGSSIYPTVSEPSEIFRIHKEEHALFEKHVPELVIPTLMYADSDGAVENYMIAQPFVKQGVQYKLAKTRGISMGLNQLPSLMQRIYFLQALSDLIDETGKLPDLDFFITRIGNINNIVVFDTTGFWYEKRDGKDRAEMAYDLCRFLFPTTEVLTDGEESLKSEIVSKLSGS